MPSEHEPIDATVKDGVARPDVPEDAPPRSPSAPARAPGGSFGCLLLPSLLGLWALVVGIWRMTEWGTLTPGAKFGAIVLTIFGIAVVSAVAFVIWLTLKLRRLFQNVQRDAVTLVEQMKYVANMGRPGAAGGRRTVENEAEEESPPAGLLLEGEAPSAAEQPTEVPDPLDDEPLSDPPGKDEPRKPDERGM